MLMLGFCSAGLLFWNDSSRYGEENVWEDNCSRFLPRPDDPTVAQPTGTEGNP